MTEQERIARSNEHAARAHEYEQAAAALDPVVKQREQAWREARSRNAGNQEQLFSAFIDAKDRRDDLRRDGKRERAAAWHVWKQ